MFTGLVDNLGILKKIYNYNTDYKIEVKLENFYENIKIGDSICVNGACLTIEEYDKSKKIIQFFCSKETYKITNFSTIKQNEILNLERAMCINSRFDGHIVTGHIEGICQVLKIKKQSEKDVIKFELPKNLKKYICKKGSVAINGVSLTVYDINNDWFEIVIIPHTKSNTNLKNINVKDKVNIETDILAKYVENMLFLNNNTDKISYKTLEEYGYI